MLAIQTEVSDGTLEIINVGILYLERDDISVYLSTAPTVPLVDGVDYQWTSDTSIEFLTGPVANGVTVRLLRHTDNDGMLNIYDGGGPFNRETLDENFNQLLFLSQEFTEGIGLGDLQENLNMNGHTIFNLADGLNPGDAVNLGQLNKSIRTPETIPALPAAGDRIGKILTFDALGNPIVEFPAADSVLGLRSELANFTDPMEGAANVARAIRHINSVVELKTVEGQYNGECVHLVQYFAGSVAEGGGLLFWDAASVVAPNDGTVFQVTGVPTGRWVRKAGPAVFAEWFGIVGDGVTLEDAKLRAAYAAVPMGGTLFMPVRKITVLMDVPALQGRWPVAVNFNTPWTNVVGNHSCLFKLKDFVSAYSDYTGVTAISTFRASRSNVRIQGLNIDANADNHYEIVAGGFKQWEEMPSGKRPPSGIIVAVDDNGANVDSVKVIDCVIYRPLQGVYIAGNLSIVPGASLDEPTFFTKTLATNVVTNCEVDRCVVSYARGNDFINVSGTSDCRFTRCVSRNSMYHSFRHYAGVESCLVDSCAAYTNYTEIASRWNETDLGYWRTNDPASPDFKIQRSGYAIGATAAQTAANSGNVRRCTMMNSTMWYNSNTDIGQSVIAGGIVDVTQATLASFFIWQVVNGPKMIGNVSYNSPFTALSFVNSILALNPTAQGVLFKDCTANNSAREGIYTLGTGPVFDNCPTINCGVDGSGLGIWYVQGGATITNCPRRWERTTPNANDLIKFVEYGTAGRAFLSNNPVRGYTGIRINKLATDIVHGTDGGGVPLTLLAGWTTSTEPARITVDTGGNVTVEGRIASAAAGTDTYASLNGALVMYRPVNTVRYPTGQAAAGTPLVLAGVVQGTSTTGGSLTAARGALAAGTLFDIGASWKVDLRLNV